MEWTLTDIVHLKWNTIKALKTESTENRMAIEAFKTERMTLKTAKIWGEAHSEKWQLITETVAPLSPEHKTPSAVVTNSGERVALLQNIYT